MTQSIDTLIHPEWIITVNNNNAILQNHSIAIKDGKIVDLLETTIATRTFAAKTEFNLPNQAIIPGLINSHGHSPMTLLRGLADDLPLMEWLNDHIWPAESKWVSPEFVFTGTQIAIAEMLRSGTTCFNDMYFFPEQTALAVEQAGIRAILGLIVINFPSAYAQNEDEYLNNGLKLHDKLRHHSLIKTSFAPHAPYTVSDDALKKIAFLADELDIPIQIHLHETKFEINEAIKLHGSRPINRLDKLGLLSPRILASHMTQLTPEDITLAANTGINVIHCPESNLKLASGYCPVQELLNNDINVALGTDGAASNNDLNMLGEMQTAALIAKVIAQNAQAVTAEQILRIATINAAKALGLDDNIGSIEIGKSADLVAIDLATIETLPLYNPVSQIVYSTCRDQIKHVWVNGAHLLKDRELTTLDLPELLQSAKQWGKKIQNN
ncbi:S-adenosylhomocysteine deaminase; Methylthioadenosine deaminase [hydrothermal vent metagenome]|uniref:S-adenosylhomocysteine deaminase Methylthioadenosine deaminase n=1 Tax=hydrothermal vent metagenome TaxID=652676 RepID=A0A3B0ZJH6_9ZZZZ